MQHLRGIHTYGEEASRLRTARSARCNRARAWERRRLPNGVENVKASNLANITITYKHTGAHTTVKNKVVIA
ncbi:hypothetical protein E2562_001038 [Oryza meyeriana var. granulata]|uniref:Uncharacterized protein n=1 Tax=Oryza meyeriana var. granulata TaxID=110450 RepID=A0A6G1ED15_9ORYZ|nr:hypothetical protein E2562_001038 [Oryza meyeriana var. granulata]